MVGSILYVQRDLLSLTLAPGTRKRIIGSHNLASNAESWMTTTTPDLVILEKVGTTSNTPGIF